jgi:GTP 3',8-cyclase
MKDIPQLAIALNNACNMDCSYCHPNGANYKCEDTQMSVQEILRLLKVAYDIGFRTFRMTGGEPTIRPDLMEILEGIEKFGDDTKILLTTNGFLLQKFADEILKLRHINVFLSIDSIEKQYEGLPKKMTPEIEQAIAKISPHHHCRINMVVMQTNKGSIENMIKFCQKHNIDLKLHDLYYCEEVLAPDSDSQTFHDREFVSFSEFIPKLKEMADKTEPFPGHGPYGIPMTTHHIGNIKVITKDSNKGSWYAPECKNCKIFPCKHGLYVPQITCDGYVFPSNCINEEFRFKIIDEPADKIKKAYQFMINLLQESDHQVI